MFYTFPIFLSIFFLTFSPTSSFTKAPGEPLSAQESQDAFFVQQCITYWMVTNDIKNLKWALENNLSRDTFLVPPSTMPSKKLRAFTTAHLEEILLRYKRLPVPPYLPPITHKQTLLHYAIENYYENSIDLLLSHKASPLLKPSYGYNAFDAVTTLPTPCYEKVIALFKQYGWYKTFVDYQLDAHKAFDNQIYG